jgi:hypothetical protein
MHPDDVLQHELERLRSLVQARTTRSREQSLVLTKLEEAELWLTRCVQVV